MAKRMYSAGELEIMDGGKRKKASKHLQRILDTTDHDIAIVIENPKILANFGAIVRNASFFNIGMIYVIDTQEILPKSYERHV